MSVHSGPRAEWWFGKRTKLKPGTEAGVDAKGRHGKVSETQRWFSYDWWFGHHFGRQWDGTFADEGDVRSRPRSFRTAAQRRQESRRDYAGYLDERFNAAERATNGNMLTKAGKARRIDPRSFFDENASRRPSMKWASDELRAWFGHGSAAAGRTGARNGGVLTFRQWQEQSRDDERQAA